MIRAMKLSCCVWALNLPELDLLRQVRKLGFNWIDIQPGHLQTLESQLLAQELGLRVSCLGASFGMPAGASLDHSDEALRQVALDYVAESIISAERVAADTVYIVPGKDTQTEALERYASSMTFLADFAAERGIKFAVEHFPATALPTAGATLEFIQALNHSNLYLLYDSGHIQISCEDPETVIGNAGDRLGYVHFDDNDGVSDLHWSLLDGVMTEDALVSTFKALKAIDYQGAVSLELSPNLPNVSRSLQNSREILLRIELR